MKELKHKKNLVLFQVLLFFGICNPLGAQKLFQRKIQIPDIIGLEITATARTSDGGVLMGTSELLLKAAPDGSIEWIKRLRIDSANIIDIAGLSVNSAEDITFSGTWIYTRINDPKDIVIGQCSPDGALKWYKVYSLGAPCDPAFQVPLSDGSFLVGGINKGGNGKTFLIKFSSDGNIIWTSSLSNDKAAVPFPSAALEAPDHSLYTIGSILKFSEIDPETVIASIYVDHYSANGLLLGKHIYGVDSLRSIKARCLLLRKDGSIVIGGEVVQSSIPNEPCTPFLLAIDSLFQPLWNTRTTFLSYSEGIRQLIELQDGRLIACTSTDPLQYVSGPGNPCHIATFTKEGKLETLETTACENKVLRNIQLTPQPDNTYLGLAIIDDLDRTYNDLSIFTIDSSLKGCSTNSSNHIDNPISVQSTEEPQLFLDTITPTQLERTIIFSPFKIDSNNLICMDTDLSVAFPGNETKPTLVVYPNPAPENTEVELQLPNLIHGNIELSLRDISGRIVYSIKKNISNEDRGKVLLSLRGFVSGIYIIEVNEVNFQSHPWRQKLIIQ